MTFPRVVAAALVLAGFAVPLLHLHETLGRDWAYFDSLSWLVRTNVVGYGTAALHDPWACGGLDVFANPQSRLLSPLGLLDLALPPHLANWLGLLLHALLGGLGAQRLFRRLGADAVVAAVGAVVFINGSFFGLHFAEGHIPFGALQLLPWVALCWLDFQRPAARTVLASLLALFLFDGGIYAFIFSFYLLLSLSLAGLGGPRWADFIERRNLPAALGLTFAAVAKTLPLFATARAALPQDDSLPFAGVTLLHALFDPRQYSEPGRKWLANFGFHEVGCYVGVLLAALAAVGLWRGRRRGLALALLFWLWAASGLGGVFNPWQLHRAVPLLNLAHVQSRTLLFVFLLAIVAALPMLQALRARPILFWLCAGWLVAEATAVRTYTFAKTYAASARQLLPAAPMQKHTLDHTVRWEDKPQLYIAEGIGTQHCYETSLALSERVVVPFDSPDYRGEAAFTAGEGKAEIVRFVPGEVTVAFQRPENDHASLVVNTRHIGGWSVIAGEAQIASQRGERLRVTVAGGAGTITLAYQPRYRVWMWAAYLLSLLLFAVSLSMAVATKQEAKLRKPFS